VAEPDTPTGPTPVLARRTSLLSAATSNPLLVVMLLSQLGVGGATIGSIFSRPSESELRERWQADTERDSADTAARVAATKCAADAAETKLAVDALALDVRGLSLRVDDVFAFQGEIHEHVNGAFSVFGRALKVTPPPTTPAAAELRAKALLRYQARGMRPGGEL